MLHRILAGPTLWIMALALGAAQGAHALQMLTEENPPFNFTESGKLTGLSTEVVSAIGERAKLALTVTSLPWQQAYEKAQSNREACVFSTVRLPNRERVFKWVGPIAASEWALFAKKDFSGDIKKLADAKPYRIGAVAQDAKVEWLKERFLTNIVTYAEDKQIPPKLTLDRKQVDAVDLWVTGLYAEKSVAASANVSDVKLVLKINRVDYYIACNPGVADASVKAMSEALATMKKDGSFQKIVKKYDERFAP